MALILPKCYARHPHLNPLPQVVEEANESLREILSNEYATQLEKGDDYTLLNPVIALTFTDFVMFELSEEVISRFRLIERNRFIEYSDDVELIFVELPKFSLELDDLKCIQDKWIYFVKNAGKLEYIPDTLANDSAISQAFSFANEAAMNREELEIQFKRRDFIILQRGSLILAETKGQEKGFKSGLEKGLQQGLEQGLEEGVKEGLKEARMEVARNLLDILDDATIASKTGLSMTQVEQLRLTHKMQ